MTSISEGNDPAIVKFQSGFTLGANPPGTLETVRATLVVAEGVAFVHYDLPPAVEGQ